jgi:hypothetical protein
MAIESPNSKRDNLEKSRFDELKDLILTNEQYKNQPFAHAEGERSYVFELTSEEKKLVYFGSVKKVQQLNANISKTSMN